MLNSKDQFKQVLENVEEFKTLGQEWYDNDDVAACAKSRSYSKRIIKGLRAYVELSIKEAASVAVPTPPEPVEEVVSEDVVTEDNN